MTKVMKFLLNPLNLSLPHRNASHWQGLLSVYHQTSLKLINSGKAFLYDETSSMAISFPTVDFFAYSQVCAIIYSRMSYFMKTLPHSILILSLSFRPRYFTPYLFSKMFFACFGAKCIALKSLQKPIKIQRLCSTHVFMSIVATVIA